MMSTFMQQLTQNKKIILPVIIIVAFIILAKIVKSNPPENKRARPNLAPQISVDVMTITPKSYQVIIDSYGKIKPRTQSILLPQVSGQINEISANFQSGAFFEKGDVLITLDDRDLKAEVKISQANLLNAKQQLSEELARVEQAKEDWKRLGKGNTASELVLRKPQLIAAEAKVLSAQANLDKATLAVERTRIVAPYSGRILSKKVDIGQVVSPNTQLAEIYAVDYVEIRLPLKNKDLPYINLPEQHRYSEVTKPLSQSVKLQSTNMDLPTVDITSDLSVGKTWQGMVVRTEGAFDNSSQQLFVVAQIDDPYGEKNEQGLRLKIGQYVNAKINGRTIEQAITIPNSAIYQGSYVYIVEQGLLKRKEIVITWQNDQVAIIHSGLQKSDLLVLTPLGQVNSGTAVSINSKDGHVLSSIKNNGKKKPRGNHEHKKDKRGKHNNNKMKADKVAGEQQ